MLKTKFCIIYQVHIKLYSFCLSVKNKMAEVWNKKPKDNDHFKRLGMEDIIRSLMRMVLALGNSFHLSKSLCRI